MPKLRPHVTDAELAVLELLWELGRATIRELTDRLYEAGSTSEYATVQKLLERLEGKRLVGRSRSTVPHVFKARVSREKLIDSRLRDVADALCGGSLAPLLTQLVSSGKFATDDVQRLRELVEKLDGGKRSGS